jgi:NAD(P)-dependent dehydrogenase (short-subunit alcohol dehydrogenase family)
LIKESRVKLTGKVVLITGTSPNIGGGIAEGMADEGAKLVCVDVKPDYANGCAEAINKRGGEAIGVVCDATDEAQVQAAVARAQEAFGGVDVLVNGAVIFNRKGVLDMPLDEWSRQIAVILSGAFLCTKHVAQRMIAQGRKGSIINIISTAGHQGEPWNVGYSTGKSGLLNFTRSVAMELAEHGIRVNSLTPTATDATEGQERAVRWGVTWNRPPRGQRQTYLSEPRLGAPLRQLPSPRHYAQAAVFLASDDSEMITGVDLRVDAGTVARYWLWHPGG